MPRVLLVDDDPDWRLLVRLALESDSTLAVVGEAGDGHEAVEVAAHCRPDLVLLDCSMPRADAFDGLPGLRATCPGALVILLSGHEPSHLRLAASSAGALGFLRKDTPPTRLAGEVLALAGLVGAVGAVVCTASTTLAPDVRSAGAARRFISATLEPWRLGTLLDTVTLLASELVANAVVHAGSEVDVAVQLTDRVARVEVTDRSSTTPGAPTVADTDQTSGRGLWMVDSIARDWGVRQLPAGGKTVWFEVARGGLG
jgi:DNA-binding NarL/FixJ family response regulator